MKRQNLFYLGCLIFLSIIFGCKPKSNPVVNYFQSAEIQYETDEQQANIVAALNDILTLPIEELKDKKYKNYRGRNGQWDLQTLIKKHFMPDGPKSLGDFYRYLKAKETQDGIRHILKKMQQ